MTVILSPNSNRLLFSHQAQLQDHSFLISMRGKFLFSLKKNCCTITHIYALPMNVNTQKMLYTELAS